MKRFQKRPVVIQAMRVTGGNYGMLTELADTDPTRRLSIEWCCQNWDCKDSNIVAGQAPHPRRRVVIIKTLEGTMQANEGDWVIKGIRGELYPCKHDIFMDTYREID